MWTVRYFKAKKFYWLGLSQQPTLRAKVTRVAGQLLPWSFENFDWPITAGAQPSLPCAAARLTPALPQARCGA
jgi:hypothetical protein